MLTTDIRQMSMSMISSMGNFLPKTMIAVTAMGNQIVNWVAVGGGEVIAKSSDGNVWSPAATVSDVTGKGGLTYGYGIAYGKDNLGAELWVACGEGTLIAKSTDGITWTPAAGAPTSIDGNIAGISIFASGVAYGKDNLGAGLWVATGYGGIIAKSSDGNIWTPAATVSGINGKGGITGQARDVAYGRDASGVGLWVAVGQGGIIAKSTDGNVWTPAATSVAGNVGGITMYGYGVAYGKDNLGAGLWVAVGGGGIIAKSSDGNVWTPAATSTYGNVGGITSVGVGVAYGKDASGAGLWVAVGRGGIIAKSPDGNVWTPAATSIYGNVGDLILQGSGVAYGIDASGVGLWVATALGGIIAKSTDGNVWTPVATSTYGNVGGISDSGVGVAFKTLPPQWVAVGDGGVIAKSTDGNVWTPAATVSGVSGKGGITISGYGVAYGKDALGAGLWVAVGSGGIIAKSTDGNVWTPAAGSAYTKGGLTRGYGVAYGKDGNDAGLWVAVGEGECIAKSTDGNVWTPAATVSGVSGKGGITGYGYGVAYGKDGTGAGLWVAVGEGGIIAKSTDGNVWTPAAGSATNKGGITTSGRGVAYGKDGTGAGLWVAVGQGGLIAKSTDGNVWTPAAGSATNKGTITNAGYGVAYGKDNLGAGLWVAIGNGGIIAKSSDGNVWTPAADKGGIGPYGYGVAYGKDDLGSGLWVAVGPGGLIAKSTNGNVWTPAATVSGVAGKGGITDSGRGAAFNEILYLRA